MKKILSVLAAAGVAAVMLATTQPASAGPNPDQPSSSWTAQSVDAQLAKLAAAGATLDYRRATPSDRMLDGVLVVPTEARTAGVQATCNFGWLCLYPDANGGGTGYTVYVSSGRSIPDLGQACSQGVCYAFNDHLSSWQNNSQWKYAWYYDIHYSGASRDMPFYGPQTINVSGADNDQASSVRAICAAGSC